jgi:hypothetical protein
MESIPLIYPPGTDSAVELSISEWHETIVSGELSDFLEWDSQGPNTSISARIGVDDLAIHPIVEFTPDGKSVEFDFESIQIPTQSAVSSTPVVLKILKQIRWTGPVLDPLPTSHYIDVVVNEYPPSIGPVGDFNQNGVVDAADYVVWCKGLGTIYAQTDYGTWRAHFGQIAGSGLGARASASVPEPASLVLLTLAAAGVSIRWRW